MKFISAFALIGLLGISPASAINKCIDDTGKVSYQDEQCPSGKSEELKLTGAVGPGNSGGSDGPLVDRNLNGSSYESAPSYRRGGQTVYTGPRGGQYTIGPSGNKNYVPRGKR